MLSVCQYTTGTMCNLMMDLLDLAQIECNQFKLNKQFFSLYQAFENAKNVVNHCALSKRLNIVLSAQQDK
jgi:signal transduction histidine kinase